MSSQKIKIYWRLRPDRINGSDDFPYFQIHLRFGPLDSEKKYFSRYEDELECIKPRIQSFKQKDGIKKCTTTFGEIWKSWKTFEIDFDPFRMVSMAENKKIERTWWAFEVVFQCPDRLMDITPKNCKIRSIKQSPLDGVTIPEDNDDEDEGKISLHPRNLMLISSVNGEFMI